MTHDPFNQAPQDCEACQQQLSEIADAGAALTTELSAHLDGCAECAKFAEQWLHGPPPELARPVSAVFDAGLRERILDAAAPSNVVRFPGSANDRPSWTPWLGRIAAGLALAGLSYWLLNPMVSPARKITAAPTLTQSLLQMEDRTKHEQQVLQTALVDGGAQVRDNVAWSVSALDL